MTSSGTATVTLPTDRQILITREFDAPKHLVYRAWTEPDLVRRWWPTDRGEMTVCEIDLRVGGAWRFVMVTPTGVRGRVPRRVPGARPGRADRLDRGLRGDPRSRRQRVAEHADADRGGRPDDDDRPGRASDGRGPRRPHQLGHGGGHAGRPRPAGAGGGLAPLTTRRLRAAGSLAKPRRAGRQCPDERHNPADQRRRRAPAGARRRAGGPPRMRCPRCDRAPAGWCWCPARRGSARRRSSAPSPARCAARPGSSKGACDALAAPQPLGAFVDLGGETGRPAARPGRRSASRRARCSTRWPTSCPARRRCWSSRTSTGRTRRRSTCCACSAAGSRASRRWSSSPTGTTPSARCIRCGCCWATWPPLPALGRVAWSRCPLRRSPRWRPGTSSTRHELHRLTAGNPFYVHEVLEAGGAEVPATVGEAVYARAARMSPDARSVLEAVSVAVVGARAVGAGVGLRRRSAGARRVPGRRHAGRRRRPGAVPPRAGAAGDRGRARAVPAAGTARRAAGRAGRSDARDRSRPAGTSRRGRGRCRGRAPTWRPTPPGGRPRSARTARRPRSTPARCGSRRRHRRPSAPSWRPGWRTRCTRPTTRWSRSPPGTARWSTTARRGDVAGEGDALCHLVTSYSCRGAMDDARDAAERGGASCWSRSGRPALGAAYDSLALLALYGNDLDDAIEWGERAIECSGDDDRHASQRDDLGWNGPAARRRARRRRRCSSAASIWPCGMELVAGGDRAPTTTSRSRRVIHRAHDAGRRPHRRRPGALRRARPRPVDAVAARREGALGAQPGPVRRGVGCRDPARRRAARLARAAVRGPARAGLVRARGGDPGRAQALEQAARGRVLADRARLGRAAGGRPRRGCLAGRRIRSGSAS